MDGQSLIAPEVLARYAADAAREVEGVSGLADGGRVRSTGVVVEGDERAPAVTVRVDLAWGARAADVGAAVQARVVDYLGRMADVRPTSVDVVVVGVGPPSAGR